MSQVEKYRRILYNAKHDVFASFSLANTKYYCADDFYFLACRTLQSLSLQAPILPIQST